MISGSGRRRLDAAPPRKVVAAETKRPPEGGRLDSGEGEMASAALSIYGRLSNATPTGPVGRSAVAPERTLARPYSVVLLIGRIAMDEARGCLGANLGPALSTLYEKCVETIT